MQWQPVKENIKDLSDPEMMLIMDALYAKFYDANINEETHAKYAQLIYKLGDHKS